MAASKETKTSRPISGTEFGADVVDALGRAARELPGTDPGAHVFLESRLERRIEIDAAGSPDAVTARVQGLAAEWAPGSGLFASAPRLDDIERLVRSARGGAPERRPDVPHADAAPPDTRDLGPLVEALVSLVHRTGRAADGASPRLLYVEVDQQVAVVRRDGRAGLDRRRGRRVRLQADGAVEERVLPADGFALEGLEHVVAARARARTYLAPPWPGRTPVVFAPGVGGVLFHELVGHALEADGFARQPSMLARADRPIAPAGVTVLDDPRRGRLAWRFDDEGEEARPVVLLQEGTVAGRLASWGWPGPPHPSTGHGRRASFAEPVLPRMGATFLTPGPHHPDEALQGIARGIYVRRMAAAWTDPAQGKASFHVTDADEVIGGRLERALAPFLLLARVEDLASLERIADDLAFDPCIGVCVREGQALASSVGAPTFRLGLITVAD